MDGQHRWKIRITTVDGQSLYWHKAGRLHTLAPELGVGWVQRFQPQLFQILPQGDLVPQGHHRDALDIAAVTAEPA